MIQRLLSVFVLSIGSYVLFTCSSRQSDELTFDELTDFEKAVIHAVESDNPEKLYDYFGETVQFSSPSCNFNFERKNNKLRDDFINKKSLYYNYIFRYELVKHVYNDAEPSKIQYSFPEMLKKKPEIFLIGGSFPAKVENPDRQVVFYVSTPTRGTSFTIVSTCEKKKCYIRSFSRY